MKIPGAILATITILFTLGAGILPAQDDPPRPNIILILSDDLGLPGISAYGSDRHQTPEIDSLADSGILFENGYVHPKCGPSRWAITTGQYPFRNAVNGTGYQTMFYCRPGNVPFIEKILGDAGYYTAWLGKPNGGVTVREHWNEYVSTPNGTDYWPESINNNGATINFTNDTDADELVSGGAAQRYVDYSPKYLNDYALDFLERRRNETQPFYLYYSMNLMHAATRAEHTWQPTPHSTPIGREQGESESAWQERCLDDMVKYMDFQVGEILDKLDATGRRENTLVVFLGDNGGNMGSTIGGRTVKGGKNDIEDGGSHVPFLLSWPARFATGQQLDTLVQAQDLLPTFAELAGAPLPENHVIDGHSFAPLLLGQTFTPRGYVYSEFDGPYFVRGLKFRLDHDGKFWDATDEPFSKTQVDPGSSAEAQQAYDYLSGVLDQLDPLQSNPTREWTADSEAKNVYWTQFKKVHFKGHQGECADAISADAADPDNDLWPNLFEMAFNTDPQQADSRPQIGVINGELQAQHPEVQNPYVDVIVEVSDSLDPDNWKSGNQHVEITVQPTGEILARPKTTAQPVPAQYIRLRAQRTQ